MTASPHWPRQRGLALVLVLVLLGFVTLLAISLATLTRVETSVATHAHDLAVARRCALQALHVAVGQLQRHAGPDTRVTATAESFGAEPGRRFHLGIWDAATASAAPVAWLVSGSELSGAPGEAPLAGVSLVGAATSGGSDDVLVPLVDLAEAGAANARGRYAWWVGDQGVKAAVGFRSRASLVRYGPYSRAQDRRVLEQQLAADRYAALFDARAPENAAVDQLGHYEQLQLLGAAAAGSMPDLARAAFHDWCVDHRAVLASTVADPDPRRRGLRRDLSLAPAELGAAFAAFGDFGRYLEPPGAGDAVPPITIESPRRRHRIVPPVEDAGLVHVVAPVLTLFVLQFNVRTRDGATGTAAYEARARMVLSLWNPYTSALVPEPLRLEVEGLPTVTVRDSNGGAVDLPLQALFGAGGAMRVELTTLEADPADRGDADDRSWLPGRVYAWRSRGGDPAGGWQTEFYNRTLSLPNAQVWVVPAGTTHAGSPGADVTFSIVLPPTTVTVRLRRAADDALLATYTSPTFVAPSPVPPYRDNEYRFGFPFRLVESFDTALGDPGQWLTTTGRLVRDPRPPPELFRPFASGGGDPTLYVGAITVSAPERLLDRVMGATGRSYDEDAPLFELPRQPLLSIGALQHLDVAGGRPFTIGNPWGAAGGWNRLFDRYFFSGLSPDVVATISDNDPLPSTTLHRCGTGPGHVQPGVAALVDAGAGSGRHLLQGGAFNVNSVRPAAWRAVFGSVRFPESDPWRYVPASAATGSAADGAAPALLVAPHGALLRFSQSAQEVYRATPATAEPFTALYRQGLRPLSEPELDALATAAAQRVREKHTASGPFRSLEDFLAPRAEATFGGRSMLEAVIADAGLNAAVDRFSSRFVTPADVLTSLGPHLFVRSDTFLVRAYGESVGAAGGEVRGRAWCEAVVQRFPTPAEPLDPAAPTAAEYQHPPGVFGRRFEIVAFRWLSATDI